MDTNHNTGLVVVIILFLSAVAILLGSLDPLNRNRAELQTKNNEQIKEEAEGLFLEGSGQPIYISPQILASDTGEEDVVEKVNINNKDENKWRPLVEKYFPEEEVDMALAIIERESSGYKKAVNWDDYHPTCDCYGSFGLFQLGKVHMGEYGYNWENRFDPETNVRVAYEVWKLQGWKRGWKNSYYKILHN